ncbi:DUF1109 domain-containing protein [Methylosinus sp. H3A]|uniref:NrsF family protein n=1 Tax=Methylosinus sp. H3A TaxID=2785786 RepID=UPI0018C1F6BE|nr:NrsF family protein [Methylosinus sp. H3A]MBG0808019.1 DUF1109 domain-containing protein [Methylosinus sp. H3A]
MTSTPELIELLAANLKPVQRLRPPIVRAFGWLLLAAVIVALLAVVEGFRTELGICLRQANFLMNLISALVTGVSAILAAFMLSLPDRSRHWIYLPVPSLALWMSGIGYQCLTNWISVQPGGVTLGETSRCFATLVLTSLPLSLASLLMLRCVALLRPLEVICTGSLAVGAVTAIAMSLFHVLDATAMVLIWHLGTACLFVGIGAVVGSVANFARRGPGL